MDKPKVPPLSPEAARLADRMMKENLTADDLRRELGIEPAIIRALAGQTADSMIQLLGGPNVPLLSGEDRLHAAYCSCFETGFMLALTAGEVIRGFKLEQDDED